MNGYDWHSNGGQGTEANGLTNATNRYDYALMDWLMALTVMANALMDWLMPLMVMANALKDWLTPLTLMTNALIIVDQIY